MLRLMSPAAPSAVLVGFMPAAIELDESTLLGLFLGVIELLGLLSALHAVMFARTSQGAIAWMFALVFFPFLSLPLYWVFGHHRFRGYLIARRTGESEIQQRVHAGLQNYKRRYGAELTGDAARFHVLEELARLPFSAGNDVDLLIDGEATFNAIFDGIESARNYLLIEFFIIRDDRLGREFQRRLVDKAKEGVRVFLLYDELGSRKLPNGYIHTLQDAGVAVHSFRSARGWRNRLQLNFRNHRKIVVADGHTAYVGGLNVADEYVGRHPRFGHWRDTHVKIGGPAVPCVQLAFLEDWYWSTGEALTDLIWQTEQFTPPNQPVVILPTGPADDLEYCGLFFVHAMHSARKRLWVASPYFVPDQHVISALQLAALRGVDVRVLLPAKPDHLLVYLSGFSFIEEADDAGVKFYRYQKGFLHQKVLLVDDDFAAVGTANLDNRSFRLNFEITVAVADAGFAAETAAMLETDFSNSELADPDELQRRPFWFRLAVAVARLMAPIQ